MPRSSQGKTSQKLTQTGLNTNSNGLTSDELTMGSGSSIGIYVTANSGTHDTHVLTLQISPDEGVTWIDVSHTITGAGNKHELVCVCDKVRMKVTTPEGGTSTVDLIIIAK